MNKKVILSMLVFVFLFLIITPVSAQPPFDPVTVNTIDLVISSPKIDYFPVDEDITLYFHVFNLTGFIQNNITSSCVIHTYDQYGNHFLIGDPMEYDAVHGEFELEINSTNNNRRGAIGYIIQCESLNEDVGGAVEGQIMINGNGEEPFLPVVVLYIIVLVLLFIGLIACIIGSIESESLLIKWLLINVGWYTLISFTFFLWKITFNYFIGQSFIINVLRSIFLLEMIATPMLILMSVGFIIVYLLTSHVFRDLISRGQSKEEIMNSDEYGWYYKLMWRYKR